MIVALSSAGFLIGRLWSRKSQNQAEQKNQVIGQETDDSGEESAAASNFTVIGAKEASPEDQTRLQTENNQAALGLQGVVSNGASIVVKSDPGVPAPIELPADPQIKIRIIAKPKSEEPDWVNEAWVGLEIPVIKGNYKQTGGQEVVSGKYRKYENYVVPVDIALELLKEKNPEAEKWWRENAKLAGVYAIGFETEACELIGE